MQYKFVVDGEWRHDEHQPHVSSNYGTVNTVLLARESDYLPPLLNPQFPAGSNMDVDNEAFQRLVWEYFTASHIINTFGDITVFASVIFS